MPASRPRPSIGNLPAPLSTFIGREREIAQVKQLLAAHRLVALTGPGGSGKTRLALQVANDLRGEYPEGVWLAELASLTDGSLVTQTIASLLNVREQSGRPVGDTLADYLSERETLLVIDNCEHLIEACAQFAETILLRCPNLRILATSREMLGVEGESVWTIPPLSLPAEQPSKSLSSAQNALTDYRRSEAIQLFENRAASIVQDFVLTPENAPWVSDICRHLDGMPLAIELAAARVRTLSVQQIAQRLDDRFHLLVAGSRTAEPRQQTLAATLDWSYALLSDTERNVLQRLSVFSGGASLDAAEAVCSEPGAQAPQLLDVLSHLVEKSLVVVDRPDGGETRYQLLETIRQYAHEKLGESGSEAQTRKRHFDYFRNWVENAQPHLYRPERFDWLTRIEAEHDNIRAALEWSQENAEASAGFELVAAMGYFWMLRAYFTEGRTRISAALAHRGAQARTLARAQALHQAGILAFHQSEFSVVRTLAEESLGIASDLGPAGRLERAHALEILAEVATETGDYSAAPGLYEQALRLFREAGDLIHIGDTLKMMGWTAMRSGDFAHAEDWFNEGLDACRQSGDPRQINSALAGLGELAVRRGQFERAREYLIEALDICRSAGEKWGFAIVLGTLGWVALRQGDFVAMRKLLSESLAMRLETGDRAGMAWCLEKLAEAHTQQSLFDAAATIFGAAAALRAPVGSVMDATDQPEYERLISNLHTGLDKNKFEAAWSEGQAMTTEQAIAYALADPALAKKPVSLKDQFGGLTDRERQVAALIAQGKSNREIAAAMTVGPKTVETYVTRILNKLGFDSRVQIATWMMEKGSEKKERP